MEMGPTLLGAERAPCLLLRTDGKIWRVTETERHRDSEKDTGSIGETDRDLCTYRQSLLW